MCVTQIVDPDPWNTGELRQPVERTMDDRRTEWSSERIQADIVVVIPVTFAQLMRCLDSLHALQVIDCSITEYDETRLSVFRRFLVLMC